MNFHLFKLRLLGQQLKCLQGKPSDKKDEQHQREATFE